MQIGKALFILLLRVTVVLLPKSDLFLPLVVVLLQIV
ncbi:MAG: hypothetical protein JWQ40_1815 [Segetibacter sp.]|nr:hypothetical protein [Segetibacter sp.]